MKIDSSVPELPQADRQTDIEKVMVTFLQISIPKVRARNSVSKCGHNISLLCRRANSRLYQQT